MDDNEMLEQIKHNLSTQDYLGEREQGRIFQWLDTLVAERKSRHTHTIPFGDRPLFTGDLSMIADHVLAEMEYRYVTSRKETVKR